MPPSQFRLTASSTRYYDSLWLQQPSSSHFEPSPPHTHCQINPPQLLPSSKSIHSSPLPAHEVHTQPPSTHNSPLSDPTLPLALLSSPDTESLLSTIAFLLSRPPADAEKALCSQSVSSTCPHVQILPVLPGDTFAGRPFRNEPSLLWLLFVSFIRKLAF